MRGPVPWALVALAVLLLLWLWQVYGAVVSSGGPNGQVFGVDFSHTYAGAVILSGGGNPYDYHLLSLVQHALLRSEHVPVQAVSPTVRVGSSAFFLWIWRPLSAIPYQVAALIWIACSYALAAIGFLALLQYLGWKRRAVPCMVFLATPQVVLATYFGNVIDIVFAGIACSLPLLKRHPFIAGVLLSLAMLQPPVALPIVLLIVLFLAPRKTLVLLGFLAAIAARQCLTVLFLGPQYEWWWLEGLGGFSGSIGLQPNLASLSGLYVNWAPYTLKAGLEVLSSAVAGSIMAAYWWKSRRQPTSSLLVSGWLWFIWMIATPYAHFVDELLLVIPIVALLGPDGRRLTEPLSVVVLYLMILSVLLFSWTPLHSQFLWLPIALAAVCLATRNAATTRRLTAEGDPVVGSAVCGLPP